MQDRWTKVAALIHHSAAALYYSYKLFISSGLIVLILSFLTLIYKHFTHQTIFPVLLFLIIPLGVILAGVIFWAKIQTSQEFQSHNPGLKILVIEHNHTCLNNNGYLHYSRIIAEALHNGVASYKQKFSWTGKGEIIPSIDNPRQKIHLSDEQYGTRKICTVDFEKPLKATEKIDFNYSLKLIDNIQKAQPFLGHTVYCKKKKLILRVRFSEEDNIKSYKQRIFMSPVSEIPLLEKEVVLPLGSREACWEIPRPKIGFKYQIIW